MPIYEYRCRNGHTFEVFQSMSEDPVSRCPECAAAVERVFHPVAVHFKGSGFYSTDYARASGSDGKGPSETKTEAGKKSDSEGSAKKESGGEKAKAGSSDE